MRSQWWQNLLHKVTFLWQAQWLVTEINPQNETYNYSIVIEHKWFKIQFHSHQEICRNINLLLIRCGKKVHFAACMGTITCVCDVSLGHRDPVSTLYNDSGSINPLQELQIIEEMKVAGSHHRDKDCLFCWLVSCVWHACLCKWESRRICIGFQKCERAGTSGSRVLLSSSLPVCTFWGLMNTQVVLALQSDRSLCHFPLRTARLASAPVASPVLQIKWEGHDGGAERLSRWIIDALTSVESIYPVAHFEWNCVHDQQQQGGNKCSPNFIYLIFLKKFLLCTHQTAQRFVRRP